MRGALPSVPIGNIQGNAPDTFSAYASQAFVAYYALQSVQAALSAWRLGRRGRATVYVSGVVIAVLVIVFAVPAVA